MPEVEQLYSLGMIQTSHRRHWNGKGQHLAVISGGRIWLMISCSQISGQMSFKDMTDYCRTPITNEKSWADSFKEKLREWKDNKLRPGIKMDGEMAMITSEMPHEELINNSTRVCELFKLTTRFHRPFVSTTTGLPVVSDGKKGIEVQWTRASPRKAIFLMGKDEGRKHYKVIWNPCLLSNRGELCTPIERVIELINENFVQFADPFATRNLSKRYNREIKTINPGQRQKMRKIERSKS